MDDALQLTEYLPLSFKTESEQEYIQFLWEAFDSNYNNQKYQFAFLAYHMLTMSFIYFNIWQIKQTEVNDFEKAMIGFTKDQEKSLLSATSPFTLWLINESNVMRFLKLIGCSNEKIGNYAALVKDRNSTAHTNGIIFLSTKTALDLKILAIMRIVREIQSHSKSIIEKCYQNFLLENNNPEEREYFEVTDQIREVLIHQNYLSQKDIEICKLFDLNSLNHHPNIDNIRLLHETLKSEY
jgi:hypothetical protein